MENIFVLFVFIVGLVILMGIGALLSYALDVFINWFTSGE